MNKAANTYWDSRSSGKPTARRTPPARRPRAPRRSEPARRTGPWWLSFLIVTSIFVMLCVSINLRAFSEMREEEDKHVKLAGQVQNLVDENLALQEEIHTLKTDPRAIQREARRIGMNLQLQKVPVPVD